MPTHWDGAGHVNGWMPKFWGSFLVPLVMAVLWLIFLVLPRISPRGFEMEPFARAWGVLKVATLGFTFFIGALVLHSAKTQALLSPAAVFTGIGLLFVVIGYVLTTVTRNFFVGIRTPWTLANEEVWRRTHQLSGKLFMAAGLVVVATSVLHLGIWPAIAAIFVASFVPIVYSYVIYRRLGSP